MTSPATSRVLDAAAGHHQPRHLHQRRRRARQRRSAARIARPRRPNWRRWRRRWPRRWKPARSASRRRCSTCPTASRAPTNSSPWRAWRAATAAATSRTSARKPTPSTRASTRSSASRARPACRRSCTTSRPPTRRTGAGCRRCCSASQRARLDGLDVAADLYPYTAGSNPLDASLPVWAREGGRAAMVARLTDPATRAKIKAEILQPSTTWENQYLGSGGAAGILVSAVGRADLKAYQGRTLADIAKAESTRSARRADRPHREGRHDRQRHHVLHQRGPTCARRSPIRT